jgi:hypothetical protein
MTTAFFARALKNMDIGKNERNASNMQDLSFCGYSSYFSGDSSRL